MSDTFAMYDENSHVLRLWRLTNKRTQALVIAGVTVTADIIPDGGGTAIVGSGITLTYDGSEGNWSGVYPSGLALTIGTNYEARVTIDGGSAESRGKLYLKLLVQRREVRP